MSEDPVATDRDALLAINGEDESSRQRGWRSLFDRYQTLVYQVARAHVGSDAAAQEASVNAWTAIFHALETRGLARSVDPSRLSHYIAVTAANNAHDLERASRRHGGEELPPDLEADVRTDTDLMVEEEVAVQSEAWREVRRRLNPQERTLLDSLRSGTSSERIQQKLGISEAAYHKRLSRLRQRLEIIIEAHDLMQRLLGGEDPLGDRR